MGIPRLAALIGLLGFLGSASAAEVTYDTYEGPCEGFNAHAQNRGLRDPDGNTHVNTLGWTLCRFKAVLPGSSVRVRLTERAGKACAAADYSKAEFSSDHAVVVLRWDHSKARVSDVCQTELERTEAAIREHESHHVADCKAIVDEAARAWTQGRHRFKVCKPAAEKTVDLVERLRGRVEDALRERLAKMNREMEYRSKATHERIGYGSSGLNCNRCKEQ